MAQNFVGIDLGLHTVKVTAVSVGMRKAQVIAHEVVNVDDVSPHEGEEDTRDELDRAMATVLALLEARGWKAYQAAVTLPSGESSYRSLSFPFADAKRIAQAVSFEIEGQFPIPLDQLAYDHVVVAPEKKGAPGRALVVATPGETVERVTTTFRAAGVDLRLVTVGAIATAQALEKIDITPVAVPELAEDEPMPELPRPVSLVVDVGHQGTELLALCAQGPLAARSIRRGSRHLDVALARAYRLDVSEAHVAKEQSAFLPHAGLGELSAEQRQTADQVAKVLGPLLREIEHTRRWLEHECNAEVTELRTAGGGAQIVGFDAWLEEQTGLPVKAVTPEVSGRLRDGEGVDWAKSLASFGAALGAGRRPLLQLRELDAAGGMSFFEERFGTVFTLGAAVLAFFAIDSIVAIQSVTKERDAYEAELAAASEQVFGDPMYSADEVLAALEGVGGEDLTSQVPERGAFEVLAMIHRVAKPVPGPEPIASTPETNPDGSLVDPTAEPELTLAPVPDDEGIVIDDALEITYADIGPLKFKILVTATRATAQDRFANKLREIECVSAVQKGKIRDKAGRKEFEMNIDHSCYKDSVEVEKKEEEEADSGDASESDDESEADEAPSRAAPAKQGGRKAAGKSKGED